MKKLLDRIRERFAQPKWRHGKLGALLMAVFLAACVLFNIAAASLEDAYGWRRDLSFNSYATTGEETQKYLDTLTSDVELYLLYQSGAQEVLYQQIAQVLNRYKALCDRVKVLPTDVAKNPGVLTQFTGDVTNPIAADSVVAYCPDTGRYKVLAYEDFLTQGYNVELGVFEDVGLDYEKQLTEAIVYVSQAQVPTVGVLQGHGELTMDELKTFTDFLKSNNYDSVSVNLLSGGSLDGVDMLLIASPQNDLGAAELSVIAAFAQAGGSLFVTRDYTDPLTGMDNYLSLLKSYGVVPVPGLVVADKEDVQSYYGEQIYLLPYMCELDMTLPLINGGMDVLLMPAACAFETPGESDNSLTVGTVLKSGANAYVRDPSDGNISVDKRAGDQTGEWSLALFAHRMHANGSISRLFAAGNSTLFTDEYIYQLTFAEQFIMQVMGELLPQKTVSLDIMAAAAFRPQLTVGSQTLGVALIVAIPLLVAMAALCVLLPRKNR